MCPIYKYCLINSVIKALIFESFYEDFFFFKFPRYIEVLKNILEAVLEKYMY